VSNLLLFWFQVFDHFNCIIILLHSNCACFNYDSAVCYVGPGRLCRHNNKHNRQSKASVIIGTIFENLTKLHSEFVEAFTLLHPNAAKNVKSS